MIELKKVTKKYPDITAVKDLNLTIKKGDFLALTGKSGVGKSTILNIIGGLISPTSGSVSVSKKKLSTLNDKELSKYRNQNIGFIFQEFHLDPDLTVEENVLLPTFLNYSKRKRAHQLIKEVGLGDKIKTKTKDLSGGQKERIAIARALINKPKILLADEPTGNLDDKTAKMIIKLLKDLHKKHKLTIVVATHDPKVAKAAKCTKSL